MPSQTLGSPGGLAGCRTTSFKKMYVCVSVFVGAKPSLNAAARSVVVVVIGIWVGSRLNAGRIVTAILASSLLFFLITNFGAWLTSGLYPLTAEGLVQAYVAGIPFLQNSLIGNAAFTALLFGGYALLQRRVPALAGSA